MKRKPFYSFINVVSLKVHRTLRLCTSVTGMNCLLTEQAPLCVPRHDVRKITPPWCHVRELLLLRSKHSFTLLSYYDTSSFFTSSLIH